MKRYGPICDGISRSEADWIGGSQGFSVIELAVTIAIIAIMTAAAIPAVNGYISRHAPQHAADEIYGDIQLARMRAARNNQRCRIQFNQPALNQYTLQDVDNNGNPIGNPFKVGDLARFRGNISFVISPSAADNAPFTTIEFLPQGILDPLVTNPANSDSVFITNSNNEVFFRVLVSAAGGTSVYRWDPNAIQWK